MTTYSSILAWKIPWTRGLVSCSPWGHRVGHDWAYVHTHSHISGWSWDLYPQPASRSQALNHCVTLMKWKWSHSVVSDPQRPHGLQSSRLLRPWDFPGKTTGVGCHCLLCSVVNEADVFLELSSFFNDPVDIGNLLFGSYAFSKSSLSIWKFLIHVLLKPSLENFRQSTLLVFY